MPDSVRRRAAGLTRSATGLLRRLPGAGGESAVVVPVPVFDAVLAGLHERFGLTGPPGMPAHITVLYPFVAPRRVAGTVVELAELASAVPAFTFTLARVGRFPGVVYAAPEPAEPFVQLTEAVARRWPSRPPYGGRFPDIVPHCTVSEGREP